MVVYKAPYDEYEFLFHEVFDVLDLAKRLGHEDLDRDFIRMVMEGWGNYCTEVLLPLNEVGDREGLVFESGEVTMPSGCLLYTSPSPRDQRGSRMPSSA